MYCMQLTYLLQHLVLLSFRHDSKSYCSWGVYNNSLVKLATANAMSESIWLVRWDGVGSWECCRIVVCRLWYCIVFRELFQSLWFGPRIAVPSVYGLCYSNDNPHACSHLPKPVPVWWRLQGFGSPPFALSPDNDI